MNDEENVIVFRIPLSKSVSLLDILHYLSPFLKFISVSWLFIS